MNIISATSPRWADEAQTAIDMQIEVEGLGIVPFTATPTDTEAYGRALFALAVAGEFGVVAQKPPLTPEQLAEKAARDEIVSQRQQVKADAFVQQFVEMTPAQVIAYVNANVTNLADAKQLLTKFGMLLLFVAKDQFR